MSPPFLPHALSDRARSLYEALFRRASSTPEHDYRAICEAWVSYSGADTVWLWLGHSTDQGRTWHLVAHEKDRTRKVPEPVPACYEAVRHPSVVEYAAVTKRAVFVETPEVWQATRDGVTYAVQSQVALKEMGCRSFITIPLLALPDPSDAATPAEDVASTRRPETVVGAICLHYSSPLQISADKGMPEQEFMGRAQTGIPAEAVTPARDTLEWMGRFTAIAVDHSTDALQRRMLLRLNDLAGSYLVASSVTPVRSRRRYLEELVKVIQEMFQIECVSIFYRTSAEKDRISLLYTTGLSRGAEEGLVGEPQWATVQYTLSETHRTSLCLAQSKTLALNQGVEIGGLGTPPRSYEVRPGRPGEINAKDWSVPALLLPIPRPASEPALDGYNNSIGVIRFAHHGWKRLQFGRTTRPFDPVEIQTLMFMAEQIGPVLETMARNIEAEKAIANQRHELRNSMRVINQLIEQMTAGMHSPQADETREVRAYNLWDLKYSALLAKTQVQRLYRDDMEDRPLEIEHIYLYGKIIARICEVVGRHAFTEKKVSLVLDHRSFANLPKLHVDPWYVEQAFLNLLINAVKYSDENSEIKVWSREDAKGYTLLVRNHGIGVKQDDKERIFERGFRSAEAKEETMGAGLGLTISRLMMRRHAGDVVLTGLHAPTIFGLFFPGKLRFHAPTP